MITKYLHKVITLVDQMLNLLIFLLNIHITLSLNIFQGKSVIRISDNQPILINDQINLKKDEKCLLIIGTYAADFNSIEYAQKLRHYKSKLEENGISKFIMILNASPPAVMAFRNILDLPKDIELYSDKYGEIGKSLPVNLGWNPEDKDMNPYVKLFGMLLGFGAWMTLPSVISGYIGNPWSKETWIEDSLLQGQLNGRWPNNALEIDESGKIKLNKFSELPYVGEWGRRPFELATLRLQNMLGISLQHWSLLKPNDDELTAGVLTQLGACLVLEGALDSDSDSTAVIRYQWKDEGICHVADFENILKIL